MKKTHYEKIVYGDRFSTLEYFKMLDKEFADENFTYQELGDFVLANSDLGVLDKRNMNAMANMLFHTYNFYRGHGRLYEISDGISDMLMNTRLDVDCSLVKTPFREIILLVPPKLMKIYNQDTGLHDLYTIYVHYNEERSSEMRILCVGKENENSVDHFDDALYYFRVDLIAGKAQRCLQDQMEDWKKNPEMEKYSSEEEVNSTAKVFQLVLNCLLYITSADPDIRRVDSRYVNLKSKFERLKSNGKKRKLERQIAEETKLNKYVIGASIVKTAAEQRLYSMIREGGTHKIRYPVGGHYRMQWYGQQEERFQKHKWIRPHFRGPEMAELIRNIGVIK